jgi:hypothetical protein
MARQYSRVRGRGLFDTSSRAAAAALLGLALLAAPLACGSDGDDGAAGSADDATEPADEADRVSPREARPAATNPEPSAAGDDEPPATPAASDPGGASDEGPASPAASADDSTRVPAAVPAAAFASCTRSEGSYGTNCDYLYVTMTEASSARCVQLTIDNCGDGYGGQGLPVDTPLSWQLSSASIGSAPDDCELGVFNPDSAIVVSASGEISWDELQSTRALPTGIVVDVTLQPSSAADDTTSIEVVTTDPLNPARCED